jgi:hypothetical protein
MHRRFLFRVDAAEGLGGQESGGVGGGGGPPGLPNWQVERPGQTSILTSHLQR